MRSVAPVIACPVVKVSYNVRYAAPPSLKLAAKPFPEYACVLSAKHRSTRKRPLFRVTTVGLVRIAN
jgi:hypothetical protein